MPSTRVHLKWQNDFQAQRDRLQWTTGSRASSPAGNELWLGSNNGLFIYDKTNSILQKLQVLPADIFS